MYNDNENIFVNRFNYIGQKEFDCFFEGHKNYLDIHIILNGKEKLGYSDISELNQVSKYDLENDFIKFEGPIKNYIDLKAGDFVITFPEDIHMPKISINDETIEKIVCKVLILNYYKNKKHILSLYRPKICFLCCRFIN